MKFRPATKEEQAYLEDKYRKKMSAASELMTPEEPEEEEPEYDGLSYEDPGLFTAWEQTPYPLMASPRVRERAERDIASAVALNPPKLPETEPNEAQTREERDIEDAKAIGVSVGLFRQAQELTRKYTEARTVVPDPEQFAGDIKLAEASGVPLSVLDDPEARAYAERAAAETAVFRGGYLNDPRYKFLASKTYKWMKEGQNMALTHDNIEGSIKADNLIQSAIAGFEAGDATTDLGLASFDRVTEYLFGCGPRRKNTAAPGKICRWRAG
jgi:hypothetical protein